jgi:hypothetical protein
MGEFREENGSEYHVKMVEQGTLPLGLSCVFLVNGNSARHGIYNKNISTEYKRRSIIYNLDYKTLVIQGMHASLSKLT